MNRKLITTLLFLAAAFTVNAQAKKKKIAVKPSKSTVKILSLSQLDSASYAFGLKIAESLGGEGVKELNYMFLNKGMQDVFTKKPAMIDSYKSQTIIQEFLSATKKAKYDTTLKAGANFLTANKAKAGIFTTASGLQYEILKDSASGVKPKATDEVTVHYKGTLLNGKTFDSSYDRKEPATFGLNKVIPGWTEGVQLMNTGSKYRFFIPYQLAYGERGAGANIPPYSTLIFEVELLKITPPAPLTPPAVSTPEPVVVPPAPAEPTKGKKAKK
ncbi:MAG: FKBP-type peptidyl-prolyl cis-trans isomerase [Sphingobacteriales bacterium]|nr:MAG: FKBP-type peptidyl-prolyl cis-trans isomerase [Sphingobacteriales bacterium]TAF81687.1 MAG: FKBP-type peptidyl-prolyl cis-trans isomerase [Sphingobacteriales bacterium]